MHQLLTQLLAHAPVLTDGGWGTQLQARGLAVGDNPDAWNLSHPEKVREVAAAYVAAGSQIVLTNTFGASRIRLAGDGFAEQAREINERGAAISKDAAGQQAKVFASVGPTGKVLMMEEVDEDEVTAAFTEQCQALAAGGADGIVIETMGELAEAVLAVQAAKATGLPVVACMCYDSGKDLDRTLMGTTPEAAAEALLEAGADLVGANCGQGIETFAGICRRLHEASGLPVWVKANAGLPQVAPDGGVYYPTDPAAFATHLPALREAGLGFIGGCCGTTPDHIAAVAKALGLQ